MKLEGRRIFITGGGGFIGSHLCERLVAANRLTVYDSGVRDALRYTDLLKHPNLHFVRGDILDLERLRSSAAGAEVVIHLAAVAGVSNYYSRPVATMRTNVVGTDAVLQVAREVGPRVFLNFSTSEVYGPDAEGVRETDATAQGEVKVSRWTYSVSKLAAEHLCFAYFREYGLPVVSVRPFNVYGPGQVGEGAIQAFVPKALRHEPLVIHGEGQQVRAWCFIDDLVDGCLACLQTPQAAGETFNLGNPTAALTVVELARRIVADTRSKSEIVHAPHDAAGDVRLRIPNIDKAERVLGFHPKVSLEQGLARTIAWYRDVYSDSRGS